MFRSVVLAPYSDCNKSSEVVVLDTIIAVTITLLSRGTDTDYTMSHCKASPCGICSEQNITRKFTE
jgi:hypothetical protein